ncbi:hypothetical protein [uncultured Ruegeria sp.]|uniref:hypothetical protein n=1 Tax=uncultured Ruegeria sp. TaxID=259304 RepID=UPI00261DF176|nr:hypothetical protein [uncultured Ruegeria sp.]
MVTIPAFISKYLVGSMWHTTSVPRFEKILDTGFIFVDPPLPDSDRYGGMPFVRAQGGVSLFDFPKGFDLEEYEAEFFTSSIGEFLPFKRQWGRSVWLRINTDIVAGNIKSGREIRACWKSQKSTKRFMAEIEGAHLGDIPVSAISDAYEIGEGDACWSRRSLLPESLEMREK